MPRRPPSIDYTTVFLTGLILGFIVGSFVGAVIMRVSS